MGTVRQSKPTCEVYEMVKAITSTDKFQRCNWKALTVKATVPNRRVTPAIKRRVLEFWAEHSGENPRGYAVTLPEGVLVVDMDGFWPENAS